MQTGHFLNEGADVVTLPLSDGARRLKRAMLDCFATQRRVLEPFAVDGGALPARPGYDFTLPPHDGTLWYERFPWGMTGPRFRALAAGALEALGLEAHA